MISSVDHILREDVQLRLITLYSHCLAAIPCTVALLLRSLILGLMVLN